MRTYNSTTKMHLVVDFANTTQASDRTVTERVATRDGRNWMTRIMCLSWNLSAANGLKMLIDGIIKTIKFARFPQACIGLWTQHDVAARW